MLEVRALSLAFGAVPALREVDLTIARGQLCAVIGPNGAGKSSLFNCISGIYRPDAGQVLLAGRDITRLAPHRRAALGLGRTFQNLALFEGSSVLDNLMTARYPTMRTGLLRGFAATPAARRQETSHRERVEHVMELLDLAPFRWRPVGSLAYGWQKRVELARAVCSDPQVLLLDEPTAGMNREEIESIVRYVLDVREQQGMTMVVVEHNLGVVMDIAERVVVLDRGAVIADGSPQEVAADDTVRSAYLGEGGAWTEAARG